MYATQAELADYIWADPTHEFPAGVVPTALLRRASNLVDDELRGAVYNTDPDGNPTDLDVQHAIKGATCEQASAWVTNGIDPAAGVAQLAPIKTAKSALGVSVSYDHGTARGELEALARGARLSLNAWAYLNRAGLISAGVGGARGRGYDIVAAPAKAFDPITGRFVA